MKNLLPLIVAFILGLVAVFGVQEYIKKKDAAFNEKIKPKTVIVASTKINSGQKITVDCLSKRDFPEEMLPENVVSPDALKDILNKPVNRDVYQGEPILWSFLGMQKTSTTLSQVIKSDERAITISVDGVNGVDGYIQPNDRVDMYITTEVPTKKKQEVPTKDGGVTTIEVEAKKEVAFLLLQNVTVLATGASFGRGVAETKQEYSTITLSVSTQEAGLIKFATEAGHLSLTLRNPEDFNETSKIDIFDMDSVLDVAKLREIQDLRKKRIEVYKQGKAETIER